jgi:hypothetical protein
VICLVQHAVVLFVVGVGGVGGREGAIGNGPTPESVDRSSRRKRSSASDLETVDDLPELIDLLLELIDPRPHLAFQLRQPPIHPTNAQLRVCLMSVNTLLT